jgi:hypothetical protein
MTRSAKSLAAVVSSSLLILASPIRAQDVWARVPALPKACYTEGETFRDGLMKQIEAVRAESRKQGAINGALDEKLKQLDLGTQQSRMMAFMQKDPSTAQKYMQDVMTSSTKQQQAVAELTAKRTALDEQRDHVEAQYKAEATPLDHLNATHMSETEPGGSVAKAAAAARQYNSEYQKLCAKWWSASDSPFLSYLGALKRFEVEDAIRIEDELARVQKVHFEIFGIPGGAAYKSTASMDAAIEYMNAVDKIYQKRLAAPLKAP